MGQDADGRGTAGDARSADGRLGDLRTLIATLSEQMTHGFEDLRAEMRDLRGEMNRRFEQVDRRFEQIDRRFEQVDGRFEQVDRRFAPVDDKHDRHFTWLVGLQLTMMVAVIGVLLAAYLR